MDENLIKRIGDEYLQANHKDGETFLHTDYNEFLSIFKTSINENYYDIQKIIKGTLKVYNTTKLDGATLSRLVNGSLSSDDNTIPSSKQVKTYVDTYYNELSKKDEALSTTVSGAVSASNTAIDTANDALSNADAALDVANQASTQASRADGNADIAMNMVTELSRTKADATEMEKRALTTETGNKILFSVDPSTYVLTIKLLDKLNNVLSTGTVDLPIESLVMNVSYDDETKSITLTLQNGEKVSFSVSALVEGLVSEDTFNQRIEQLKKDLRTELTQTITDDANSSFNQNVKNKTDSFNENSSLKTNEFNNNAAQKTLDYNNNCISKTNSFNQNSTQKLTEFNDNYTSKLNSFSSNADLRMDEYNANADNKIAEYDEHSQELNNKIIDTRNELERVKNDVLETGTDTDTYIHLEDSAMAEYQELSVDGVCEQKTTSGKNELHIINTSTSNGITCTYNADGTYTLNGTATANTYFDFFAGTFDSTKYVGYYLKEMGDYKDFFGVNKDKPISYRISTSSRAVIQSLGSDVYRNLLIENNGSDLYLAIRINTGGVLNNVVLKPMLSQTEPNEYEPYTGGQPSPSPDYPQEIKTIENSLKITSCNKNLYFNDKDVHSFISSKAGWKFLDGADNSDQTETIYKAKVEKGETYTFSANITSSANMVSTLMYDNNNQIKRIDGTNINYNNTFTSMIDGYVLLRMYVDSETTVNISNVMLEQNSKATPYIQHLETQITANIPEGEFIGKINDTYKDTLKVEYNEEDGQYHLNLYKNIGKVVLDGTNNELYGNASTDYYWEYFRTSFKGGIDTQKSVIVNYLNQTTNARVVIIENGTLYLRFPKSSGIDVSTNIKFNEWAKDHNVIIYYALKTPYVLDLGVVDMPIAYNEITNLFTDSDLLPTINAKYYRNFISTIQNLQVNEKALKQELIDINTRLSALESVQTSVVSESEVVE